MELSDLVNPKQECCFCYGETYQQRMMSYHDGTKRVYYHGLCFWSVCEWPHKWSQEKIDLTLTIVQHQRE